MELLFLSIGAIILGILAIRYFYIPFEYRENKKSERYEAGMILVLDDITASDRLDELELQDISMRLNPSEACYYEGSGTSYHSKEVVVGYKNKSYGRSMRVMRGFSIRNSSGSSRAVRETVNTAYPGRLFITNDRIVFLAERYGFDIGFNKLSSIMIYDEYLEVFAGSKFYRVYTPDCVYIRDLITLMNICHEEQYSDNVEETSEFVNYDSPTVSYTPASETPTHNSISALWNYGTETDWLNALANYDRLIEARDYETQNLEKFMNEVNAYEIEKMAVEEFYDFLYDKYFVWKFTQKNYLANSRKYLRRYVNENSLSELKDIQRRLFSVNHSEIGECFAIVTEIHGLATAGASGLLAILFPDDFGTVDQFVVNSLKEIDGIGNRIEFTKMNPKSLNVKDGIVLTKIFREKAKTLNAKFETDFWTPRKIDMVLWAFER